MRTESRSQPISRVLSAACAAVTVIPLDVRLPARSSHLPASSVGHVIACLFGVAPGGGCHAIRITTNAVRSYRTFSPLPAVSLAGSGVAVYFLCHFPSGCPDRALPGALPLGVRTFLSPRHPKTPWRAIVWPAAAGTHAHKIPAFSSQLTADSLPYLPSFSCEMPYCSSFL